MEWEKVGGEAFFFFHFSFFQQATKPIEVGK